MTVQPSGIWESESIPFSVLMRVVLPLCLACCTFRIAPSTMSALRRSLRAGFAAAKRATAVNAVGAAAPARAIIAGSLRTQVRSDNFSETGSSDDVPIDRPARADRSARQRACPRDFRSRDGSGGSVPSSDVSISRPTPQTRPRPRCRPGVGGAAAAASHQRSAFSNPTLCSRARRSRRPCPHSPSS